MCISKTRLLSALTWLMWARRAVTSDPAAKESRAIAQTVLPLDFQLLSFQQLSVIKTSFFRTVLNLLPDEFMLPERQCLPLTRLS